MLKVRSGRPVPTGGAAPDPRATRRKFLRRQRARRWLVWRRVLAVLAVAGLVAGAVWLVFFSSVLAVKDAEILGVEVLTKAEVEKVAAVPRGEPLATADLAAVRARVEGLAAVESVEVTRAWPDTVRVAVTERKAVAAVSWDGQWQGLDGHGVLFRTYPDRPEDLPRVNMRAGTPADALVEAAIVVEALPSDILGRVEYVDVGSIDKISLHLSGGAVVNWGSGDESDDKAAVLTVLLERPARVYDVTAPGRPTIRN